MASHSTAASSRTMVEALHVAYPVLIASLFAVIPAVRFCTGAEHKKPRCKVRRRHQWRLRWLSPAACLTFVMEAILYMAQSRQEPGFWPQRHVMVYTLTSVLTWASLSVLLAESTSPLWSAYIASWAMGAVVDTVLLEPFTHDTALRSSWGKGHFFIHLLRVVILVALATYGLWCIRRHSIGETASAEETTSLLAESVSGSPSENGHESSVAYGAVENSDNDSDAGDDSDDEDAEDEDTKEIKELQKKRIEEQGGWLGYLKGFLIFVPYILPYQDRRGQLWLLAMGVCVVAGNVLTLVVPIQLGVLTAALGDTVVTGAVPWKHLVVWAVLQFPISAGVDLLKSVASNRVSQNSYRRLNALAFSHVMSLSMDYHTSKSSGKVVTAIEQGTNLRSILDTVFAVVPMFIDLAIAVVYLTSYFDYLMGLIILTTGLLHTYISAKGNAITAPLERLVSETYRVKGEVLYDSITNWQTVAYHNRRAFEQDRYDRAVTNQMNNDFRYFDVSTYVFTAQDLVMTVGLLAASGVAATRMAAGMATLSDFVFLTAYWSSIRGPMQMLAWTFHETAAHLINAEWLFQLLQTKPSVADKDGATELEVKGGRVEFKNVAFAYDPARPILSDISFTAEPGQSIALVGETGGGKSTTLKLLYRFYDVTEGSITIDGQDLRDVKLDSLRDSLGAVPQDPSVFDQTILENIIYARPNATEADVIAACKAARIHDQILTFPNGYKTRVGERGVQLSGGELQRLAIARVILRQPKVVILDEATSAVDSDTEAMVQQAIRALSAGRTVFTVAHRLSTVVGADVILVVDKGRVVERGSHGELLALGGKYARLWGIQTAAHHDVEG